MIEKNSNNLIENPGSEELKKLEGKIEELDNPQKKEIWDELKEKDCNLEWFKNKQEFNKNILLSLINKIPWPLNIQELENLKNSSFYEREIKEIKDKSNFNWELTTRDKDNIINRLNDILERREKIIEDLKEEIFSNKEIINIYTPWSKEAFFKSKFFKEFNDKKQQENDEISSVFLSLSEEEMDFIWNDIFDENYYSIVKDFEDEILPKLTRPFKNKEEVINNFVKSEFYEKFLQEKREKYNKNVKISPEDIYSISKDYF